MANQINNQQTRLEKYIESVNDIQQKSWKELKELKELENKIWEDLNSIFCNYLIQHEFEEAKKTIEYYKNVFIENNILNLLNFRIKINEIIHKNCLYLYTEKSINWILDEMGEYYNIDKLFKNICYSNTVSNNVDLAKIFKNKYPNRYDIEYYQTISKATIEEKVIKEQKK